MTNTIITNSTHKDAMTWCIAHWVGVLAETEQDSLIVSFVEALTPMNWINIVRTNFISKDLIEFFDRNGNRVTKFFIPAAEKCSV